MAVSTKEIRGEKRWRVRGTDPATGKRIDLTFATKREAERVDRALKERVQEAKEQRLGVRPDKVYRLRGANLFRVVAQDYIDQSKVGRDGRRPLELNTLANYQSFVDKYMEEAFGDLTVEDMSKQDVRVAISVLRKITPSADAAKKVYRFAKSVMKWAVEGLELRDTSPMSGLDVEADKKGKKASPKTHTNEEIDRMIVTAYGKFTSRNGTTRKAWFDYYPIFMILATTGLRSSECFALTWDDLSEDMTVAHISKRVIRYVKGVTKDNRIGPPKSAHSFRDVPIPGPVAELLRARKKTATADWVFPDRAGGPKNYKSVHQTMWKPLIRDAGVRPLGIHALRHYAASLVIKEKGVVFLRDIMGHHSAAFTLATYGGFVDEKRAAMKDVGDMFAARMQAALAKTQPVSAE